MYNIYYLDNHTSFGIKHVLSYYLQSKPLSITGIPIISNTPDVLYNLFDTKNNPDFANIPNEKTTYFMFSVKSTNDYYYVFEVIKYLREMFPVINIKIIIGGAAIESIDVNSLIVNYPEISYLVYGKGEEIFSKIIDDQLTNGVYYDKDFDIIKPYIVLPPFLQNVNEISIFFEGNVCKWGRCQFCFLEKEKSLKKTALDVAKQIMYYYKNHNIKIFNIYDLYLNFGILKELLDILISVGITDVSFKSIGMHLKSDFKLIAPYFKVFKTLFLDTGWGVEFLDNDILDLYQKNITVEDVFEVAKITNGIGMPFSAFMLNGLPNVSDDNLKNNLDNLMKLDEYVYKYKVSFFILNNKVPVYRKPDIFKIKLLDKFTLHDFDYNLPEIETYLYNFESLINGKYLTRREEYSRYEDILNVLTVKGNSGISQVPLERK